jgi:hypothetical protein
MNPRNSSTESIYDKYAAVAVRHRRIDSVEAASDYQCAASNHKPASSEPFWIMPRQQLKNVFYQSHTNDVI